MKKTKPRQAKKKVTAKGPGGIMKRTMKARGTGKSKRMDDILGAARSSRRKK